mgnify:CR=1 FL=1
MTEPLDLPFPSPDDRSARAASLRSRAAVAARDRDTWLALFAPEGVIEDPVGPSMFDETGQGHRGADGRAWFWDNVMADKQVDMEILASHAGGDEVANVARITTTFPDGSSAIVPIVITYRVDDQGLILNLRAFWEMDQIDFRPAS